MIAIKEYAKRRQELKAHMEPNSIAIVPSAHELVRSRDVHFHFRQDNDFYYLTGFNEPDAVMVFIPEREHGEFVLFNRPKDKKMETWHGRRFGQEGVIEQFGVDDAFPIDDIDEILPGLIEGRERIYYGLGVNKQFDQQVMGWIKKIRASVSKGAKPPGEIIDLRHTLHEMRLFKSAAEIKLMRHAAQASAEAHTCLMQVCQPGISEADIEAEFNYQIAKRGCRYAAYPSIVAGGENACILHYVENCDKLKSGDLLLVDAGAEYQHYAADITRTYPINGKFSAVQKQVYQIVLDAQYAAIDAVKPGNHWQAPHEAAVKVLTQGLIDLGVIDGPLQQALEKESYKGYYMHKTGHWIGLDVHDVGDYHVGGEPRVFEPGMVLTVEPGLYFAPDGDCDAKFKGIGIRIEDDILVTKDGHENLTAAVPKTIKDIEAIMAAD